MGTTKPTFILASQSPRREELLRLIGFSVRVIPSNIDETRHTGEAPEDYVLRMAGKKALAVASVEPSAFVIGADTTVVVDDLVLGKPRDHLDACAMLQRLQGRWHAVLTGVAIARAETCLGRRLARTEVRFATLTEETIERYVQSGEPFDKAGAYGIQGLGRLLVEEIQGSYDTVVGLPLPELRHLLASIGMDIWRLLV